MAHYLIEVGYTAQSWNNQIDKKGNVVERITPAVSAAGGKIECLYYSFGDIDLVGIIDFPTPEDAAAFALVVGASGALRTYRTTPLLTVDQGIKSLKKADAIRKVYEPPITVDLNREPARSR